MIEWWAEQAGWIKYGIPVLLLAISTILYFVGYLWPYGWGMGFVLLMGSLCFKEDPLA